MSIHKCCQQERRTSIYILIDNIFLSCYTHPKKTESKKSLHKKINYTIDPRRCFQDVERSTKKIKGRAIVSVVKKSQILNFFYWVVIKRTRVATKPSKSSDSGECALQRVGGVEKITTAEVQQNYSKASRRAEQSQKRAPRLDSCRKVRFQCARESRAFARESSAKAYVPRGMERLG